VKFLGRQADLITALSPRSFLLERNDVTASDAVKPFLGLGQNAPAPEVSARLAQMPINPGAACPIRYSDWIQRYNSNKPISVQEILLAANELGVATPKVISGDQFTNAMIKAESDNGELAQYQVLHFATHGIPASPMEGDGCEASVPPSLVTSVVPPAEDGSFVSNGLLSFEDVARLRLNANLVVLAACETASGVSTIQGRLAGQEESAPTLDGLVRAFLAAHSRAVMATFWRVPDTQTAEMMVAFYRAGREASIARALRDAQTSLIRQPAASHPYYWAAYFVVGDGAKTMLTASGAGAQPAKPAAVGMIPAGHRSAH